MPPTRLRRTAPEARGSIGRRRTSRCSSRIVRRSTGPACSAFLARARAEGVERVTPTHLRADGAARRAHKGWIRVPQQPKKPRSWSSSRTRFTPVLPALLAPPARALRSQRAPRRDRVAPGADARLAAAVRANPGLRVPGAFDGFELATPRHPRPADHGEAATTIAGRFVATFGEPIVTPYARAEPPHPAAGARRGGVRGRDRPARHRRARAAGASSRWRKAQGVGPAGLDDGAHRDPDDVDPRLAELPGIGEWTAHYIAMRALRWPDAFPKEDIAVRKRLGGVTAQARRRSCRRRGGRGAATR